MHAKGDVLTRPYTRYQGNVNVGETITYKEKMSNTGGEKVKTKKGEKVIQKKIVTGNNTYYRHR